MTYIVAELGGTHNGDIETAKRLIDAVSGPIIDHYTGEELPGVDAVKFTKRDLAHEMTREMWDSPYDNPNSYGRTYGEHREALELSWSETMQAEDHARQLGLGFGITVCQPSLVGEHCPTFPDWYKVASRDLSNGPLLERLSEESVPIVLSTGMATWGDLSNALLTLQGCDVVLLNCISEYPASYRHLNLKRIQRLQRLGYRVGYSSHTPDTWVPVAAAAMGADWVEVHCTLSKQMRGTDHAASLEVGELKTLVGRIRHLEMAMGTEEDTAERREAYAVAERKLARSICTARDMEPGEVITRQDVELLSPGGGYSWSQLHEVEGKTVTAPIPAQSTIKPAHLISPKPGTVELSPAGLS